MFTYVREQCSRTVFVRVRSCSFAKILSRYRVFVNRPCSRTFVNVFVRYENRRTSADLPFTGVRTFTLIAMHASRKFCLFLFVASLQQAADPKQAQLLARPSLGPAAASSHRTTPQLIMCVRADHKGALKAPFHLTLCS